jgi:hypothetical protein
VSDITYVIEEWIPQNAWGGEGYWEPLWLTRTTFEAKCRYTLRQLQQQRRTVRLVEIRRKVVEE